MINKVTIVKITVLVFLNQMPMSDRDAPHRIDPLLLPFWHATDHAESERRLESLFSEHADPIIRAILSSKFRFNFKDATAISQHPEAQDVYSNIYLNLLQHLSKIKSSPGGEVIHNFRGYVSQTTYNAWNQYSGERYPQRKKLKNRLAYFLEQTFALWKNETGDWVCGFEEWRGRNSFVQRGQLEEMRKSLEALAQACQSNQKIRRVALAESLATIFNRAGGPIELDDLVDVLACACDQKDQHIHSFDSDDNSLKESLANATLSFAALLERRENIALVWQEICQLRPRQRAALLLSIKDIALFPFTRTASIAQIANALEISPDEFAQLWSKLPLDDKTIAARLGATRQQVISLRKCARERLQRRMKGY